MGYLRAKDTVNGAMGTCFAIIDGKRHELMQVKNVQAKVKKTRTAIPILGLTAKQQKSGIFLKEALLYLIHKGSLIALKCLGNDLFRFFAGVCGK